MTLNKQINSGKQVKLSSRARRDLVAALIAATVFGGLICTPFGADGELDEGALRAHVRFLVDEGGVHGIMPTGSTGEFTALTEDEEKLVEHGIDLQAPDIDDIHR